MKQATFAAGCFWGVQHIFQQLEGVIETTCGYIGGQTLNPTYDQICTGKTGHAEAVQVSFDPEKISYQQLLDIFWRCHDPTPINQQGPDIGTQYRSGIYTHDEGQQQEAEKSKNELQNSGVFNRPVVTEILAASEFFPAEEYHQHYFEKNPDRQVCHVLRP